jgi:site-specific DNA recombinase
MAAKHRTKPGDEDQVMVPAAAYYRMSDDDQKGSIEAQRLLVERFALDHHYRIAAEHEYIDSGIPGDATAEERPEFQRMLADAQRGRFQAILVRDTSRLTRSDSIDGAEELKPLKAAGVVIVTTTGLRIDLRTMEGRIMLHMGNEISNGENRNRAVAVTNGQLQAALNGSWIGKAPFGYRIEGAKKNKRLVLSDSQTVATIRRIFAAYDAGEAARGIARQLEAEGIPTACGAPWQRSVIVTLLRNPVYCGDYVFNKRHYGKYLGIVDGKVTSEFKRGFTETQDQIIHRDHWPAIVTREQWGRVQQRLDRNAAGQSPAQEFALSSKLRCSCGHDGAMHGRTRDTGRQYFCPGCRCTVVESAVLDAMGAALADAFTSKILGDLESEIRKQLGQPRSDASSKVKRLECELVKQERKLVVLDADMLGPVQAEIRRLRQELGAARQETPSTTHINVERIARRAISALAQLPKVLKKAVPSEVRQALEQVAASCRLRVKSRGTGAGRRYQLESGEIHLSGSNVLGLEPTSPSGGTH